MSAIRASKFCTSAGPALGQRRGMDPRLRRHPFFVRLACPSRLQQQPRRFPSPLRSSSELQSSGKKGDVGRGEEELEIISPFGGPRAKGEEEEAPTLKQRVKAKDVDLNEIDDVFEEIGEEELHQGGWSSAAREAKAAYLTSRRAMSELAGIEGRARGLVKGVEEYDVPPASGRRRRQERKENKLKKGQSRLKFPHVMKRKNDAVSEIVEKEGEETTTTDGLLKTEGERERAPEAEKDDGGQFIEEEVEDSKFRQPIAISDLRNVIAPTTTTDSRKKKKRRNTSNATSLSRTRLMQQLKGSASIDDVFNTWETAEPIAKTPKNALNAVWNVARLSKAERMGEVDREKLGRYYSLQDLVVEAAKGLEGLSSRSIVQFAWAMANLGGAYAFPERMDEVEVALEGKVAGMKPSLLKDLIWSLAQFRHRSPLLQEALDEFSNVVGDADPQSCSMVLYACGVLGEGPPPAVTDRIVEAWPVKEWDAFSVCTALWGLALVECVDHAAFAELWSRLVCMAEKGELAVFQEGEDVRAELQQIYQLNMAVESSSGDHALAPIPSGVLRRAEAQWEHSLRRSSQHISAFQRDVARILGNLGMDPIIEDNETGFAVDISLRLAKGVQIALEIDGPTHLSSNTYEPLGHTKFKRRMLAARGWDVIAVPINEWSLCETTDAKEAMMLNMMKPFLKRLVADE